MPDIAQLGLKVDSGQVVKGEMALKELAGAAAVAQSASTSLTTTTKSTATGMAMAKTATDANSIALAANAKMARNAAFQQRNLVFQLNDVAVTLAMGMNPMMVAMQQGGQIATIYGPEEGGIGRAFKETGKMMLGVLTKFPPLTAAVALLGSGYLLLKRSIGQATGEQVTFGDVFHGVMAAASETLTTAFGGAIDWLAEKFSRFWDFLTWGFKKIINGIIKGFLIAVEGVQAAMQVLQGGGVYKGGFADIASDIYNTDYAGKAFESIKKHTLAAARAREETDKVAEATKKVGKAWRDTGNAMEEYNKKVATAAGLGMNVFTGMRDGLREGKSAMEAFGDTASRVLDRIAEKMMQEALMKFFFMALGGGGVPAANNSAGFLSGTGLFAAGGYTGNGPSHQAAGIVHKGEYVVNAAATRRNRGMLEDMNRGGGGGGFSPVVNIDARGASAGVGSEIQAAIRSELDSFSKYKMPGRVRQIQANPHDIG